MALGALARLGRAVAAAAVAVVAVGDEVAVLRGMGHNIYRIYIGMISNIIVSGYYYFQLG